MGRKQRNRKLAKEREKNAKRPEEPVKAPDPLRDIRFAHPTCHNDNVVMGGSQRSNILIGPGPALPTGWRA
jgi:hypothetical protein